MEKPVLFFSDECPDTAPFVAELKRLGAEYEEVEVKSSQANFKRFVLLRDRHSAFDAVKAAGKIGFPALLLEGDRVVLDLAELESIFAAHGV